MPFPPALKSKTTAASMNTNPPPAAAYERLGASYLAKERASKRELSVISFLWLVGCPLLCMLPHSGSDWGKPQPAMCNLYAYSISASMTGEFPKIFGSILAPLFALYVVQRSSGGLCGILKLGWIARYSPLLSIVISSSSSKEQDRNANDNDNANANDEKQNKENETTHKKALKLWKRIEKVEYLGYLAACFLIGLVAFDAQNFLIAHDILATLAFLSLCYQNHFIGALAIDFPDLFPHWNSDRAERLFRRGLLRLKVMFFFFFIADPVDRYLCPCDSLWAHTESLSLKVFGTPEVIRWLASVVFWYIEYAFCFHVICVQLLEHYELRLWDFAGYSNMPYAAILSRFSFRGAANAIFGRSSEGDANLLMGRRTSPVLDIDTSIYNNTST